MPFTQFSATEIIQTGTDDSLVGIENIAGVTRIDNGIFSTYDLGNFSLTLNGNLTVSPERECIIGNQTRLVNVSNGGTLHIDGKITKDGHTTYSKNYWLISSYDNDDQSTAFSSDRALLRVENGGTLNWEGGYVMGKHPIAFEYNTNTSRSSVRIRSGGFNCLQFYNTYPLMVRAYTNDLDVDGFAFVNGGAWCIFRPSIHSVENLNFTHAYGIAWSGGSQDNVFHEITNYKSTNPTVDNGFWSDVWQRWINPEKGSELIIVGLSTDSTSNRGLIEIIKQIKIKLVDESSANISGAKIYIPDTDNGNRKNFGGNNYTDDRHTLLTTGADGTDVHNLLTAVAIRDSGSAQGTNDTGDNAKDYRSINGNSDDIFDIHFFAYGYQYKKISQSLKGLNVLELEESLKADPLVTQSDKTAVDDYDTISSSTQLYDALKSWLVENYQGESEPVVSKDGNKIITNNKNITFDLLATDAVSYDRQTDTITVKSSEFTGDIDAGNGTVTLGSITFNGVYVDSTRDSAVTIIGVNLAPTANRLYVSVDDGVTYTEIDSNVYPYLSHPTNRVKFKYEKGDGESGDPIVTEDDYALANSGVANEFTSFTNETGQLIQSQTNELNAKLAALEVKLDAKPTADAITDNLLSHPYTGLKRDGLTPLDPGSLGEHWYRFYPQEIIRQLLEYVNDGITPATRFQPIPGTLPENSFGMQLRNAHDAALGTLIYDKDTSQAKLYRGTDTSVEPFATFDMKDEDGIASALNRMCQRIKR